MDTPNDVVELIIAVDLDPSDPEEPINVNDVKVRDKGESDQTDGEDWKGLAIQLLMGDPASGVTSDSIGFDEAKAAAARVLEDDEPKQKPDPFEKANLMQKGSRGPKHGGGMRAALERTMGRKKDDEDEEGF